MLDLPSPNHDSRPDGVAADTLILHYTGMKDAASALDRLRDPVSKVSAHYLIDEDGAVVRLVAEERRAWHAGRSAWRGRVGLNDVSIGIELVNPGHEHGYRLFPKAQMTACVALCRDILARHPVRPENVLGHADVSPDRKEDPGELFDWRRLASAGIGLWPPDGPNVEPPSDGAVRAALAAFGYPLPTNDPDGAGLAAALRAFQRRFRPERVDGRADGETFGRLARLLCRAEPHSANPNPCALRPNA